MELGGELLTFLRSDRGIVQQLALQYVLGVSGTEEGCALIADDTSLVETLMQLLKQNVSTSFDATRTLVNVSADNATCLLTTQTLSALLCCVLSHKEASHADHAAMILSNVSRLLGGAEQVMKLMQGNSSVFGFHKLIDAVCDENYNVKVKLHYLSAVLSNLSQTDVARKELIVKGFMQRLLPFISYEESLIRRRGVAAAIRNCCFQSEHHERLLVELDVLPWLLLPLAGPEEFDDDDMERLPLELQYLEEGKTREVDPDTRRILVESVNQLCATAVGLSYVKKKNAYVIMRELHKWEENEAVIEAIENVVSLLISDDPQVADLKQMTIPEDTTKTAETTKS